jgi:hypothetical protein
MKNSNPFQALPFVDVRLEYIDDDRVDFFNGFYAINNNPGMNALAAFSSSAIHIVRVN